MRIDVILNDAIELDTIEEDEDGLYIPFGDAQARLPPHVESRNFTQNDALSLFITVTSSVALNMLSSYLYDLLKNRKARAININRQPISDPETIVQTLTIEVQKEDVSTIRTKSS